MFFEVTFKSNIIIETENSDDEETNKTNSDNKIPELLNWKIEKFLSTHMIFRINLSHPLYVSSSEDRDELTIRVL